MLFNNIITGRWLLFAACFMAFQQPCVAQAKYTQPTWWFGAAGGANFNYYSGSTQRANEVTFFPAAFRKGRGVGIFAAPLIEYRMPNSMFGFMLQQGVDDRRGTFKLSDPDQEFYAHLGYISVEPSIKLSLFKSKYLSSLYIYGGVRLGFLVTSDFTYKRSGMPDYPDASANPDAKLYISSVRKNPASMQVGLGYDILVSGKDERDQFVISPFVAYFPTMWRKNIRTIERLYLNTVRVGMAVKVGRGRIIPPVVPPVVIAPPPVIVMDRDGDGIADMNDKCPDIVGFARYEGCPVPDRDNDGVNDELDKCPDIVGVTRYQGCPVPDTDGDGVNDEEDRCINDKGPVANFGCPIISIEMIRRVKIAAENLFFATGKATLLARSFPKLNDVANLLKENPSFKVQIDGHTDFVGNEENNQTLSEQRATAVKAYLTGQGIAGNRLSAAGYGESRPVADNNTNAGKAKNRRVEMTLRNY